MIREDIIKFEGKNVFLKIKSSGYHYTCKIIKVNESSVEIVDKYFLKKVFDINDISSIEEVIK